MILFCREKSLSTNKSYCLQLSYWKIWLRGKLIDISLFNDRYWFNIALSLFGLINFNLEWSRHTDHAGFVFNLTILGLDFHFNIYDCRYWVGW
jgi:hypothetical protein